MAARTYWRKSATVSRLAPRSCATSSRFLGQPGPAAEQRVLDAELIECLPDAVVDEIHERRRLLVEPGHRRQDHRARERELVHEAQVVRVERRLAHHQYQLASLLQVHVRGAHDE